MVAPVAKPSTPLLRLRPIGIAKAKARRFPPQQFRASAKLSCRLSPDRISGDPMDEALTYGGSIRRLWVGEAELYRGHLLRLDAENRRDRFGGAVSDNFIRGYCEPRALSGAIIYGFFVDDVLRGAAELRLLEPAGDAEVALSIERAWQSQGVGTALLEHLLLAASNRRINRLHVLCLAENGRMRQLARKFDAELSIQSGSVVGEMKAPHPTPMSVMRELVADSADLALAILHVPSQLAKRLERMSGRAERLMPVDNWR